MPDPVELADSLYDDTIETVGTVSPGAEPYKLRVKPALVSAISSHTSELAVHESRLDALESGGGSGNVNGPGSATDNAIARYDGTTGKLIQNSVVTIADSTGNMAGVGTLNTRTIANWVDGPSSVIDGRVVAFDGTTGKLVKQDTRLAADLVAGPASATDNAIVRFDGTTGKLVQNSAVTVADTTGSITNTAGSGTMTSTRFIGPATALRSASTDIDVVAATAPSTGQVLTATDSTHATWQTPAASGDVTLNEYWSLDPNVSYGSKSDEMTGALAGHWSTKIWSTWAALGTNDGGVDSTASVLTGHYRVTTGARRSWYMFQPGDDTALMFSFTYVGASGFQYRIRFTPPLFGDSSSGAASSSGVPGRVYIAKDSSSNPDVNNNVFGGYAISSGTLNLVGGNITGGAGTTNATYAMERNLDNELIFRGAGNAGTITVDMFIRSPTGTRLFRSEALNASNGATLWFVFRMGPLNNASNIFAVDYEREYPDLKIIP